MSTTFSPTERRHTALGIDRSTIRPAALILAVVLFFVIAVPAVNALVQRSSPIGVGTVYPVGMDITFTPDSTWSYGEGAQGAALTQNGEASVTNTGVTFDVNTGGWDRTLTEFNTTMTDQVKADDDLVGTASSTTVTTPQGVPGILTTYQGGTTTAMTYAFVHEGAAVQVVVRGPATAVAHELDGVRRMVDSITFPKEPSAIARENLKSADTPAAGEKEDGK